MDASLAISSDKNTSYVNDWNNVIYKLDVSTDAIPDPVKTVAVSDGKSRLVLSPDDSVLFTGDGIAWDPDLRARIGAILPNNYSEEEYLVFLPNHNAVAIAIDDVYGFNDRVVFANASTFNVMSVYVPYAQNFNSMPTIGSITVTPDESKIILSTTRGMISISLASFPPGTAQALPKGSTAYFDLVADNARQVLYGSNPTGNKVDIINMATNKVIGAIRFNNGTSPKGMDISPNGNELAVALSQGGVIAFVDLNTKTVTHRVFPDTRLPGVLNQYQDNKPYDVVYGRTGRLYSSGSPYSFGIDYIHMIDTVNYTEIGKSSRVIRDGPWLAISSDKNTLFVNDDKWVAPQKLYKFDVSTDTLTDPVVSPHADWFHGNRFLLAADDSRIYADSGQIWDTSLIGQIGSTGQAGNIALLPTHNAIATGVDTATTDSVLFSRAINYFGIKKYMLPITGTLGAMIATSDGSKLFVSSDKGMSKVDLSAGLPGTAVARLSGLPYYDMVIDEARGVLYGSDPKGHKIDVISMATLKVTKKYWLVNGATPLGIDLSPDGSELAIAQNGASTILFLDPATGAVKARIFTNTTDAAAPWEIGGYNVPHDVIYGRSGRLYSSGAPNLLGLDYLHIIDTSVVPHTEIAKSDYYVRSFNALGISPDKNTLYVNLHGQSPQQILKIDVSADTLPDPSGLPSAAGVSGKNFALTPDGSKLFVDSGQVWNSELTGKLGSTGLPGYLTILPTHNAVAVTADGTDADFVAFYSLTNYFGIKAYQLPVTGKLGPMAAKSDGSRLFLSTSVGVVSVPLSAGLPGTAIPRPAGKLPYFDLVADETRGVLYGSDPTGHKIDVISMDTQQVIDKYYLVNGATPTGIALSPDGGELAVAQYGASSIVFLNPETGDQIAGITPSNRGVKGTYDVIYGRAGRLYSTDSIHVYDTSVPSNPIEIGMLSGPGSYPSMAISADGNTLYVINTYQSPEYLYRYDISTDVPAQINYTTMDYSYGVATFALMESADKVLTSSGKLFRSDLSTNLGSFTPVGRVGVIPSRNAFLSAAGKTITYFDADTHLVIGTSPLPGVTTAGPVVVLSDDSALYVTTDVGIRRVNLSVFPPVTPALTAGSVGTKDGWVLESSETSNVGGMMNATGNLQVGDNAQNKQYRSILYFNTVNLPDNAIISKVILKIKKKDVSGTDPFTTHGNLLADIKKGYFGGLALEIADFKNTASKLNVGKFTAITAEPGWYRLLLVDADFKYINPTGVTQFRIYFTKDDNNDSGTDVVQFFSGDTTVPAADRPILIVEYVIP
jgi:DNA-binding beta-propeller fold protein YncE